MSTAKLDVSVWFDFGVGKYVATTFAGEKLGNMHATGMSRSEAVKALNNRVVQARKNGTWR